MPAGVTEISVASGAARQVDASLSFAAGIAGRVTDAAGAALRNADVGSYAADGTAVGDAWTDADGRYQVDGLAAGAYQVCFDPFLVNAYAREEPGYLSRCFRDQPWSSPTAPTGSPATDATAGTSRTGIDQTLPDGASISGMVTDSGTGMVLTNVSIRVYNSAGGLVNNDYSTLTHADGTYFVNGLPPAADGYPVCFVGYSAISGSSSSAAPAGYVSQCWNGQPWRGFGAVPTSGTTPVIATAGAHHAGIDAALIKAGGITGTVTDASTYAAIFQATVSVYDSSGDRVGGSSTFGAGQYNVHGLPASATGYRVCVTASGHSGRCFRDEPWSGEAADLPAGATPVPVTAAAYTDSVDVALPPA